LPVSLLLLSLALFPASLTVTAAAPLKDTRHPLMHLSQ
jgi:hypothetical protein